MTNVEMHADEPDIDAALVARLLGVALVWKPIQVPKPHPVQSVPALRLGHEFRDDSRFPEFHVKLFCAAWRDQRDLAAEAVMADCLAAAGADRDAGLARASEPGGQRRLEVATAEAEVAGVFGVPTMVIRGEPFAGLDSLLALEWRPMQDHE